MKTVGQGSTVQVHYTGSLQDGAVFDSSRERAPLEFAVGGGQLIKGFEKAVMGMTQGETKKVTLAPDEAYGFRREELVVRIPKTEFPEDIEPIVGLPLTLAQAGDTRVNVVVTEVSDSAVTLDANHPLAGKDLIFDIEVVSIT